MEPVGIIPSVSEGGVLQDHFDALSHDAASQKEKTCQSDPEGSIGYQGPIGSQQSRMSFYPASTDPEQNKTDLDDFPDTSTKSRDENEVFDRRHDDDPCSPHLYAYLIRNLVPWPSRSTPEHLHDLCQSPSPNHGHQGESSYRYLDMIHRIRRQSEKQRILPRQPCPLPPESTQSRATLKRMTTFLKHDTTLFRIHQDADILSNKAFVAEHQERALQNQRNQQKKYLERIVYRLRKSSF